MSSCKLHSVFKDSKRAAASTSQAYSSDQVTISSLGGRGRHLQAGEAAGLSDDRGAVEDGGHDAVEVVDDREAVRVAQLLRHHRPSQAHPREAGILAEGARLQRALLCPCASKSNTGFISKLTTVGQDMEKLLHSACICGNRTGLLVCAHTWPGNELKQ